MPQYKRDTRNEPRPNIPRKATIHQRNTQSKRRTITQQIRNTNHQKAKLPSKIQIPANVHNHIQEQPQLPSPTRPHNHSLNPNRQINKQRQAITRRHQQGSQKTQPM